MPNKLLEQISIIDTPGILTAAKRKLSRGDAPPLSHTHTHTEMYITGLVILKSNIPMEQHRMINDPPENLKIPHMFLFCPVFAASC